jgi:hypothetical protein
MNRRGNSTMNRNNHNNHKDWYGESARNLRDENDRQTEELAKTVEAMKKVSLLSLF